MPLRKTILTLGSLCVAALGLAPAFAPVSASAQTGLPKILSPGAQERLPDFSYAGYAYGTKALPTAKGVVIDPAAFGAVPDDGIDDSDAIIEAIERANETQGPVIIRFAPGRFLVSEILKIERGDLVLQGAGQGQGGTELHFPRPLAMVGDDGKLDELREYLQKYDKRQREKSRNIDTLFSEYSWTGGFIWVGKPDARPAAYLTEYDRKPKRIAEIAKGTADGRTLTLRRVSGLEVGDRIEVLWYNKKGENGPLLDQIYGETDLEIGSHHWTYEGRPLVRMKTTVEGVEGTQLTLASPLLHDVNDDVPAEIARWAPLEGIGIESLAITFPDAIAFGHHLERGYNAIYLTGAADSWIRDVTITNADAGVLTYDSANVTIADLRTEGHRAAHYAVHMGNVHNVLAERVSVHNPVIHSLSFNTKASKSVYKDCEIHTASVFDQHAGSNHQNLFDAPVMRITAVPDGEDGFAYPLWDGSGAGYWQPGHGAFNTTWNARIIVEGGAPGGAPVTLEGLKEGPSARIVGLHGNRPFTLDYRPAPYVEMMNEIVAGAPSLYDYQLSQRLAGPSTAGD